MKTILFLCSGNTCRSPMAEAFCNAQIEKNPKLKGKWRARSAGVFAMAGDPASENAQKVGRARGLDLSEHRARLADAETLRSADLILVMSQTQVKAAAILAPDVPVRLLGDSIPDPFGGDENEYASCLRAIEQAVQRELRNLAAQE